jgi:hypothetical protein
METTMSSIAGTKDARSASNNVAQYVAAHPTLKIIGQQPDRIEVMDTPAKLREWRELVANSITKIPELGYTEPSGDGQTATYSYVGDKPVAVDHDCET